jgi:hypothetical protein
MSRVVETDGCQEEMLAGKEDVGRGSCTKHHAPYGGQAPHMSGWASMQGMFQVVEARIARWPDGLRVREGGCASRGCPRAEAGGHSQPTGRWTVSVVRPKRGRSYPRRPVRRRGCSTPARRPPNPSLSAMEPSCTRSKTISSMKRRMAISRHLLEVLHLALFDS